MDTQLGIDHRHAVGAHLAGADGVIGGFGVLAHPVQQLVVLLHMRPRGDFLARDILQRRRRHQFAPLADGGQHAPAIVLGGEEIEADGRRLGGVGGLDVDRARAFRPQHVHVHGDAALLRDAPLVAHHLVEEGRDRDRRIGRLQSHPGAEVHADRHGGRGQESLAEQRILDRLAGEPPAAGIVVEGEVLLLDGEFHARRIVVPQVLADAPQFVHRRDAVHAQQIGLADA